MEGRDRARWRQYELRRRTGPERRRLLDRRGGRLRQPVQSGGYACLDGRRGFVNRRGPGDGGRSAVAADLDEDADLERLARVGDDAEVALVGAILRHQRGIDREADGRLHLARHERRRRLQPGRIALGAAVDQFPRRAAQDDLARGSVGDNALQPDLALGDRDGRSLGEAQFLEELLHRRQPRRGAARDGVGPAVGREPPRDLAALQQRNRRLGCVAHLPGEVARRRHALIRPDREGSGHEVEPDGHLGDAAVGHDDEPGRVVLPDDQPGGIDAQRDGLFLRRADRQSRRVAALHDLQPGRAVGDGQPALEHRFALVQHAHLNGPTLPDSHRADGQPARLESELRPVDVGGGQRGDEVRQGDIAIRQRLPLAGHARQVRPALPREEARKRAVVQELAGVLPFEVTALDEILIRPAAPPRGEDERLRQLPRRDGPGHLAEHVPVVVTEGGLSGVDAVAAGAELSHVRSRN